MTQIPTWQEKQKILYAKDRKTTPEQLKAIGDEAFGRNYFQEALEYYAGAKDDEGLSKIETYACEEGDAFLLNGLERLSGQTRSDDLWDQLGQKAMELGKFGFARVAFTRTENKSLLEQLEARDPEAARLNEAD